MVNGRKSNKFWEFATGILQDRLGAGTSGLLQTRDSGAKSSVGGRSTKSFRDEKRWDKVLSRLRPNDYVMIQFGHNDQKKDKPAIYAPADSLYRDLLKAYIAETRAKGAHPVLVTSVFGVSTKTAKSAILSAATPRP
jgi:lysophospholipase L1-like esterase